ncbi:YcaO-like family protein [Salidesulfovibrio brasiliensis]|uniref:YcaO-like family protein n=1 Tax=Salidesulfovibrio brasiliensis TaxID=221711 RepID=UPI0006D13F4A|nr:YcaO-like family protein [Salidesulfovibrio brasiliensis]
MRYELKLMDTQAGVGCFSAMPGPNLSFSEMVDHLRKAPFDTYMHEHLLNEMGKHRPKKVEKLIKGVMADNGKSDPALTALLFEACLCHERLGKYQPMFQGVDIPALSGHLPSIRIRSHLLEDQPVHRKWAPLFANNFSFHEPLPAPEEAGIEAPVSENELPAPAGYVAADARRDLDADLPPAKERKALEETRDLALSVLEKADAFIGPAMAHKASLSPVNRLRHWSVKVRCSNGRHSDSLSGMQTSYGRGLIQERAEAAYAMEMVERYSSYASFSGNAIKGYANDYPLTFASMDELENEALDLNAVRLEVPYQGQKLHWFEGHAPDGSGAIKPILIPAQFVFLFCNLDEQHLFTALSSTGLASGNTLAEAKVAALLEVIERDADATIPFDQSRAFRIESDDPQVNLLLNQYEEMGIHVWFLDMTPEFGVPCYKSVVLGKSGGLDKGSGSSLKGRDALMSAMTETPYPFPGPASAPAPEGLPVRKLEDLPDFSTGSADGDLLVLEKTLFKNGYQPCYADLTRKDFGIPVTRAIIPGLEINSDFDRYTRISPRLWANYLRMFS